MLHVIVGVSWVRWGIGRLSCVSTAEVSRQPLCYPVLHGILPAGCILGYGSSLILKGVSLGLPCNAPRTGQGKKHEQNGWSENRHLPKHLLWIPDPVQDPSDCQSGNRDALVWPRASFAKRLIQTPGTRTVSMDFTQLWFRPSSHRRNKESWKGGSA